MNLDHLILKVNDAEQSARFYGAILGFEIEGARGPFTVVRVAAETAAAETGSRVPA